MSEEFDIDPAPEADAPKAEPTEAERKAAELEARNRLLEQEAKRANEAFMQMATAALGQRGREEEPEQEEFEVPDRDEDPDGHLKATIAKTVQEALKPVGSAIGEYQQKDRQLLMQTRIDLEKQRMKERYGSLWSEMEKDVEKYLGGYPLEQQAAPGAIQEAFNRVFGSRSLEREAETRKKAQSALGTGGHTPGPSDAPLPTSTRKLSDRELAAATAAGMTEKQFRAAQGPGRMSIDEWVALKEAK